LTRWTGIRSYVRYWYVKMSDKKFKSVERKLVNSQLNLLHWSRNRTK